MATLCQIAVLLLMYLATTNTRWLAWTFCGTVFLGIYLTFLRLFQVLSNNGVLKEDNFYRRTLASAVIIGIFIYYAECVIRAAVVESQHDDQEFKTNLTLEVLRLETGVMERITILGISVLGTVSACCHFLNTSVACCCNGRAK
ncbi:hypothetical protein ACHWQZ_G004370 [Mnemiopsis leidyi]